MANAPFIFTKDMMDSNQLGAGTYNGTIKSAKPAVASSSGNLVINLRLEKDQTEDEEKPKISFTKVTFSPNSMFVIVNLYKALDWDINDLVGVEINQALVQEIANNLEGEMISWVVTMKPDSRGADEHGDPRPDQPNVSKYLAYGAAKSIDELL